MNTTAIPVDELIGQLRDAADGIPADTAAAGLIISHENFLHRDAFRPVTCAPVKSNTDHIALVRCADPVGPVPSAAVGYSRRLS